ncbi:hypothetical protein ACFPVX_05675 [Cohnella faecalis]|uniref:Uncharacterized protein n=1 Tax=Cohnella faecalis TaxID=2315694 RepID=A0A398CCU1_9BACL|nr:hypothetical protein [Cohnella faecalis]RIE00235.1 hypothetical protein D3H35_29820 [Cohnella faecalis]
MGAAFRTLFWGFIFLFDFRINGLDILPDVVAYYCFYTGLSRLVVVSPRFEEARKFTLPLLFLSIPDINPAWFSFSGILMLIYVMALTVLNLIMVYSICMGIKEAAAARQDQDLADTAHSRWTFFLIAALAVIFTQLLAMGSAVSAVWAILIFFFSLVVYVLFLDLMRKCETRLN